MNNITIKTINAKNWPSKVVDADRLLELEGSFYRHSYQTLP